MTFKHGKNAHVYVNAFDLSTILNSADTSATLDTGDTTMFAATWKSAAAGTYSAQVSLGGLHDVDSTTLGDVFASPPGVLTVCPAGGTAIGDEARLVSANESSLVRSSPVGGMVAVTATVDATGALGFGSILHPLGVDTGTTTGASKDELAATATGWTAHLHVTAVSSGSWVVTIEDSSTGSSGWAAIATFTAATGATSQRLAAATATTAAKRYVRYVATVTGGSSPTVTFALAFARN